MTARRIGRYEVIRELGKGGMAVVYLAHDPRVNRDVAVKVMAQPGDQAESVRRFEREIVAITQLEHSAIVPVYDHGTARGRPFLVFRYMDGGSLADRLRQRGPLPLIEVSAIAARVGDALDYAHRRGVIHRDVKPANILFDATGEAWLADFGIVRLADRPSSLTGAGIIGTPEYMSPEQCNGDFVTPATDIYSLGVTLFEALTGQLPFRAPTAVTLLRMHRETTPPSPGAFRPGLPPALGAAITQALAKVPRDRWPSGRTLAMSLAAATAGAELTGTPSLRVAGGGDDKTLADTLSVRTGGATRAPLRAQSPRLRHRRAQHVGLAVGVPVVLTVAAVSVWWALPREELIRPAAETGTSLPAISSMTRETQPQATPTPTSVPATAKPHAGLLGSDRPGAGLLGSDRPRVSSSSQRYETNPEIERWRANQTSQD